MDYGQHKSDSKVVGIFSGVDQYQEPEENPYFTAGVGDQPPESNDSEPENNLDEDNWQRSLEISTPVDLPSPEQINNQQEYKSPEPIASELSRETPKAPELGEIVPINPNVPKPAAEVAARKYNPTNIRTTGDRLDKNTIIEVDNAFNELNQTGDLNNFYNEIRGTDEKPGMYEVNLHNSYNRKIGEAA